VNIVINELIGEGLMVVGLILITIGIVGLYKYDNFYTRIALASVIDTAGFILVAVGIMVYKGFTLFTLKVAVIIFFVMLLNPLSNHVMVRGAHNSGYDVDKNKCKVRNQ
jgi:multicomponent Na+:H+ antiporter subunit G